MENTTTLSNNLHSYYFKILLESAQKKLVLVPLGKKMLHPRKTGKDAYILRYGNLSESLSTLGDGVTPTASSIANNKYTISMNQYGRYIAVSDYLLTTAIDPVLEDIADRLGYDAAKSADAIVRNVLIAGATANIQRASGAATDNDITATDVMVAQDAIRGVRVLKMQDCPPMDDGNYVWVVHGGQSMDIQSDTSAGGFIELNKYVAGLAEKPLNGEVGKVYGARVVESNNMTYVANTSSVNVYRSLLLGKDSFVFTSFDSDFISMKIKQIGSAGTADPLDQVATAGYKMEFGSTYVGGSFSDANNASPDSCIQIRSAITGG